MNVQSLAHQCTSYVVNNLTSDALKLPNIPAELCQEIINFILRDRRLKRKDLTYLNLYWTTILTKLFEASNKPLFLDLSSSTISSDHLRIIGELCPTLTGLNLNRNKLLSSDSMSRLGNLPALTYLNLSNCPLVDSTCLVALSKKEFNLHTLALERCDITDTGLTAIAKAFPNLTTLILAHCSQISDASVCVLADSCPKLEVISLKACRRVSDKSISKIFSQLHNLRSINLENCLRITDGAFTTFACPSLAHLNINFCERVTPKALLRVVEVAKLETVRVQQISLKEENKAEMAEFIQKCTNAKKLNIVGNAFAISPEILEKIANCADIKSLSMGTNDWQQQNGTNPLTPELLDSVFKNLGQLEKLLFAGIPVSAESMGVVAKYCPLLKHINIRWCTDFNDAALSVIANGFPNLERITITSSTTVTNTAIAELCAKCPRISELKLIGCTLISDPCVAEIAKLKNLQRLILSESRITNEAIKYIVMCTQLRELDISACSQLSPPAVALLTAPQPGGGLKHLDRLSWEGMLWMNDEHVVMLIEAFPLLNLLFLSGCPNITGKSIEVKDMDLVISLEHKDLKMNLNNE